MFKQYPQTPSTDTAELSCTRQASANTFWDTGGGKGGRGKLNWTHRVGGGQTLKTAGKNETRESEGLRGKPRV